MQFVNEQGNSLELDIVDYQFDGESEGGGFDFDANWLLVKLVLDKDGYVNKYQSACILTSELSQLTKDLEKLMSHQISSCKLVAIEPYLQIKAEFSENYKFEIQYIYDRTTGERFNFTCTLNENEMRYILEEFNKLSKKYKER